MEKIVKSVLLLAAYGLVLTLCEQALPRSGLRKASRAVMGLLFMKLLADQITGILR